MAESPEPSQTALTLEQTLEAALQLQLANRLPEAAGIYRQILAQIPDEPDALNRLGCIALQTNDLNAAIDLIGRAAARVPSHPDYQMNLGRAFYRQRNLPAATECFARAAASDPNDAKARHLHAAALLESGRASESADAFRAALRLRNDADSWTGLGLALQSSNGDLTEAAAAYQSAIALNPRLAAAHSNLAEIERTRGNCAAAIASAQTAIAIDPNLAAAYNNLGAALQGALRFADSIAPLERAIQLDPKNATAHMNLAAAIGAGGRIEEAGEIFKKALELQPNLAVAHSGWLFAQLFRTTLTPKQIYEAHVDWARRHADPLAPSIRLHDYDRSPDRKLRVGYLSTDFRRHSVAFFIEPILEHHHRDNFEIVCYHNFPTRDDVTRRLQALPVQWREVAAMSEAQLADQIRNDQMDLLIDLGGQTSHRQLLVMARKPAPVQISYLGYPATTGLSQIDYRITDAFADPPGSESLYAEKLVRLPCAWCYRPFENSPPVNALPALSNPFTFGSFNHVSKYSPESIELFAAVLQRVPNSRLVLKSRGIELPTVERLRQDFARHGISESRLEILGPTSGHRQHLEAYHQIDLSLDTFPYAGTTTTCDALWMGVPVVTLAGESHVSRVGASLLRQVDLNECIATTPGDYVTVAARFAGDCPRLARLRELLRDTMSRSLLTDAGTFTRHLESAYRQMWHRHVASP